MNVLIIAFYYPPDPAIGAVRTGVLAEYLVGQGHKVIVLSSARRDLAPGAGGALRVNWRETRTLKVVNSRDDCQPIDRSMEQARDLAVSPTNSGTLRDRWILKAWTRVRAQGSLAWRINRKLRSELVELPDGAVGWVKPAISEGSALIRKEGIDIILASGPPFSSFIVARWLAGKFGIPWTLDYRDLWTYGEYYSNSRMRRQIDRLIENHLLKHAGLLTTVSDILSDEMKERFKGDVETIQNGVDIWDPDPLAERRPLSDARVNLVYVGSELYGGRRSPELLFQAAEEMGLTPEDLRFHFIGGQGGEFQKSVQKLAESHHVQELVKFSPHVPRDECMQVQSRADGLLLLLWNDPRDAGTLSGKIFEYIAARRPIVMIGNQNGEAARLIDQYSLGLVVSNQIAARAALEKLLRRKVSPALEPDLPRDAALDLSREKVLAKWESALLKIQVNT